VLDFSLVIFVFIVCVNRYVFGLFLKKAKGSAFDQTRRDFLPSVSVIVPMYNEGESIYEGVLSLLRQDYPDGKLNVIVVDDYSRDESVVWAERAARTAPARVRVIRNSYNMGKRLGILHAVRTTKAEIIVSVDSDTVLHRQAVRQLVARFNDPEIAAVGGRVNVRNANESWISRMQVIKYYFAYEFFKNLECYFRSVLCLSGCLTAYRRSVLVELEPVLINRNVLGVPIKYGEDRFLTRQILKAGYKTFLTQDAICWTNVPTTLSGYWSQQLRWRRSNIIDFLCGVSHCWKMQPLVGLQYASLFAMLFSYPLLVVQRVLAQEFFELALFHISILALCAVFYAVDTRKQPASYRVHPIWFLPMVVLMPVTYLLMTPLALLTLDSSSWETRGHAPPLPLPDTLPSKQRAG